MDAYKGKFSCMYTGFVTDRDDPEARGRVRIRIPGLIEEGSGWANQVGSGGGAAARGTVAVPPVGAEVCVFFNGGNVDQPYYFGGHIARDEQLTGTDGHPDVYAIETAGYVINIDDRDDLKALTILDKASGNLIQMNGRDRSMLLRATSQLDIQCTGIINISGLDVVINGEIAGFGKV